MKRTKPSISRNGDLSVLQHQLDRKFIKRNRFQTNKSSLAIEALTFIFHRPNIALTGWFSSLAIIGVALLCLAMFPVSLKAADLYIIDPSSRFRQFSFILLFSAAMTYFLSGVIKGVCGIGTASVSVPIMSELFNPTIAIALVAVPLIVTNLWQGVIVGDSKDTFIKFYPVIFVMTLTMLISAYFSASLPELIISLTLGTATVLFALWGLCQKSFTVPANWDLRLQILTGVVAGVVGGLSGLFVIPLLIYMHFRPEKKNEAFVAPLAMMFLISGIVLLISNGLNGSITNKLFLISCLASLPALIGVFVGEKIQRKISNHGFKRFILFLMLAMGGRIIWVAL